MIIATTALAALVGSLGVDSSRGDSKRHLPGRDLTMGEFVDKAKKSKNFVRVLMNRNSVKGRAFLIEFSDPESPEHRTLILDPITATDAGLLWLTGEGSWRDITFNGPYPTLLSIMQIQELEHNLKHDFYYAIHSVGRWASVANVTGVGSEFFITTLEDLHRVFKRYTYIEDDAWRSWYRASSARDSAYDPSDLPSDIMAALWRDAGYDGTWDDSEYSWRPPEPEDAVEEYDDEDQS